MSAIKRIKSFKEEFAEMVKKIVLLILAVIMLYFFLPVGLVTETDFTDESGELIKISPYEEIYSDKDGEEIKKIGLNDSAYIKFSLNGLSDTDIDEINSAKLRISFMGKQPWADGEAEVCVLQEGINPQYTYSEDLFLKQRMDTVYPQTGKADDYMCVIDITELVKSRLESNVQDIIFKISGKSEKGLLMADRTYEDPVYRPCISVAAGVESDDELQSLERTNLSDAVYVSSAEGDKKGSELAGGNMLIAGDGNEVYLRFNISEPTIAGAVYSAMLSLDKLDDNMSRTRIYCINNDEWTSGEISYNNRPRGDESTAFTSLSALADSMGRVNFDVTQAVCEARRLGIDTLTFRIVSDKKISFAGGFDEKTAPQLHIKVSDDKDKVCASEAALKALGKNKAAFVTSDLLKEYTASNGGEAKIRWTEYETDGKKGMHTHITSVGEVTRPKWFEGNKEVMAVAEIRSGKYHTRRQFSLNIPAEASPDYRNYSFGNYIDIGDEKTENIQKFEYINVSGSRRRWVEGRMFSYRVLNKDGVMALNFSCMPDADNYITLKLWEGDSSYYSGFEIELCDGSTGEKLVMTAPVNSSEDKGGFVYASYALPRSFTEGKNHISLRLSYAEDEREVSERGIYAAYLTQSSYFEPKQFAKQGEKSISKPRFGEEAIDNFIENLKALAIFTGIEEEAEEIQQIVDINAEKGSVVFAGRDVNIAFSVDEIEKKAVVYQKLEYYDRYSEGCRVDDNNGVITVNYGTCKLIWNKTAEQKAIPHESLELSGAYRDAVSGEYYIFSEKHELTDDSAIPEDAEIINGYDMVIQPEEAVLLVHIADPIQSSDWRVSHINGRSISELIFGENEKIQNIKIKSVGRIIQEADDVTVVVAVYDKEKLTAMGQKTIPVIGSIDTYIADMSEFDMFIRKGNILRVFVYDNTESLVNLSPKLEMP